MPPVPWSLTLEQYVDGLVAALVNEKLDALVDKIAAQLNLPDETVAAFKDAYR